MTTEVSIVLVNWNSVEVTSAALRAIDREREQVDCEVFVVDNGSTDTSIQALPQRFPWIRLLRNRSNVGFSRANNAALRQSAGRYLLVLNNDTEVERGSLRASLDYMDAHPDVGALGILHLNADSARSHQASSFGFPRPVSELAGVVGVRIGPARAPLSSPAVESDVDWICGSFMLIRRRCLEEVGLLDERFFIYDEDIDWCRRAWRCGWRVRFWPGASLVHTGSAARPFMRDKTFVHFRSRLSYLRKHHSALAAALYYIAVSIRLTGATAAQLTRFAVAAGNMAALHERYRRQVAFMTLRPGSLGG